MKTPDIEIREILTDALAAHVPARDIERLTVSLALVVAHALDTALFDTREQERISARVQWYSDRWYECVKRLAQITDTFQRHYTEWRASSEAALQREKSPLDLLDNVLGKPAGDPT